MCVVWVCVCLCVGGVHGSALFLFLYLQHCSLLGLYWFVVFLLRAELCWASKLGYSCDPVISESATFFKESQFCNVASHFTHSWFFPCEAEFLYLIIWLCIRVVIWSAGLPWCRVKGVSSEWEVCDWGADPEPDPVLPPTALRTQPGPAQRAEAESGQMVQQCMEKCFFFPLCVLTQRANMHLHCMAKCLEPCQHSFSYFPMDASLPYKRNIDLPLCNDIFRQQHARGRHCPVPTGEIRVHKQVILEFGSEELDWPAHTSDLMCVKLFWHKLGQKLWARPHCPTSVAWIRVSSCSQVPKTKSFQKDKRCYSSIKTVKLWNYIFSNHIWV